MYLRPNEVRSKYKISHTTLFDWEKRGLVMPQKTPGGHRRYKAADIEAILGRKADHSPGVIRWPYDGPAFEIPYKTVEIGGRKISMPEVMASEWLMFKNQ